MMVPMLARGLPRLFAGELADGSLSNRLVGRISAILYLLSGIITVLSPLLPTPAGMHRGGVVIVGLVAVVVAAIVWQLPWERWPRSAALWLIPPAFVLIGLHNHDTTQHS